MNAHDHSHFRLNPLPNETPTTPLPLMTALVPSLLDSKPRLAFIINVASSYVAASSKIQRQAWPFWVGALAVLSTLGTSSADAAPHAKAAGKNKISHTRSVARGTYLLATGGIDPTTSSVKAISADNHFTWVRLMPSAVITQGGRNLTSDKISEGDKLLCQGDWADDGWGPIFQANRVDVVGSVSETALQDRVAAACQTVTADRGTTAPDDSSADNAGEKYGLPSLSSAEENTVRSDAENRAFVKMNRLAEAADEDRSLRHNPAAVQAMRGAVADYKRAIDWRQSLPIAPAYRMVEAYERQGENEAKVYANLLLQYFGTNSSHGHALMSQSLTRSQRLNAASKQSLEEVRDQIGS